MDSLFFDSASCPAKFSFSWHIYAKACPDSFYSSCNYLVNLLIFDSFSELNYYFVVSIWMSKLLFSFLRLLTFSWRSFIWSEWSFLAASATRSSLICLSSLTFYSKLFVPSSRLNYKLSFSTSSFCKIFFCASRSISSSLTFSSCSRTANSFCFVFSSYVSICSWHFYL